MWIVVLDGDGALVRSQTGTTVEKMRATLDDPEQYTVQAATEEEHAALVAARDLNSGHTAKVVRAERDALLKASDFTQLDDAPVTDKQAWKDYRKALRDVPDQAGFPASVTWPEPPE